jgi:hypothetical protein
MRSLSPSIRSAAGTAFRSLPPTAQRRVRTIGGRSLRALSPNAQDRILATLALPSWSALFTSEIRDVPLELLDAELAEAARLFEVSEDQARAFLDGFRVVVPEDIPPDPFSAAYREWTWDLYHQISGRQTYEITNEASPFDLEVALTRPYPFQTESAASVARDLEARSRVIGSTMSSRRIRSRMGESHKRPCRHRVPGDRSRS